MMIHDDEYPFCVRVYVTSFFNWYTLLQREVALSAHTLSHLPRALAKRAQTHFGVAQRMAGCGV